MVPFYNVEAYLEACLESIRDQSFADFEVLLVDDGSPDGSIDIARGFVEQDPRFRLVARPNGGLGAARNTGVRVARGGHLTFVDSDDLLPTDAFAVLVEAAVRTGADIVTGSVERFDSRRSWRPAWTDEVHAREVVVDGVADFLPVLRNLYTWNKLFRRDFWDACGLWFRERVAYEDQPIITQLYAEARRIAVLPDVVYRHRVREDRSSISQQVGSMSDLQDRISAWRATRDALRDRPTVYVGWLATLFSAHFHWYFGALDQVSDDYWQRLREAVLEFLREAPPLLWEETVPTKRVPIELVRQGRRKDVVAYVAAGGRNSDLWPARLGGDGLLVELPFVDDPTLDRGLFVLHPRQIQVDHRIDVMRWNGADLEVTGWCYLRRLPAGSVPTRLAVHWRNERTDEVLEVAAEVGVPMVFPPPFEDLAADYSGGGFRCVVPGAELASRSRTGDTWTAALLLTVGELALSTDVSVLRAGVRARVRGSVVIGDRCLALRADPDEVLGLHVRSALLLVDELVASGRELLVRLSGGDVAAVDRVLLVAKGHDDVESEPASGGGFRMFIPEDSGAPVSRRLVVERRDARVRRLPVSDRLRSQVDELWLGSLPVEVTGRDVVTVAAAAVQVLADAVDLVEGRVRVSGRLRGAGAATVSLVVGGHAGSAVDVDETADAPWSFAVECNLVVDRGPYGRLPLPVGEHELCLRVLGSDAALPIDLPLRPSSVLSGTLPHTMPTPWHEGRLQGGVGGGLRLNLARPLGAVRSPRAQRELRLREPEASTAPGLVLQGARGSTARADLVQVGAEVLRRAPDLPVWWVVGDHSEPVPEGCRPVLRDSVEHHRLSGRLQHVVGSRLLLPRSRPPGQIAVELFDEHNGAEAGRGLAAGDLVVTSSPRATRAAQQQVPAGVEVLELGAPRLDRWHESVARPHRDALRRWLGIGDDRFAVLVEVGPEADLEPEALVEALGPAYAVLVKDRHSTVARSGRAWDVARLPDLGDLVLLADLAVVTPRAAIAQDAVAAGRPIVQWGEGDPLLPGPRCRDVSKVAAAVAVAAPPSADAVARYRDAVMPHDDGAAAARLVDRLLDRGDDT